MPHAAPTIARQPASVLALGFRPFFLLAGAWALAAMLLWLAMLRGLIPLETYYGPTTWHAHEMLFGYTGAVIAGFLLTAVRNWTGLPTPTGATLGTLAGLWLAARAAPFLPLPGAVVAALDLAFLPALALALIRPLWSGKNRVNRVFLVLLAAMTLAALLVHLDALGLLPGAAMRGNRLMVDLVVLTLLLVAGRVMPFFTERGAGSSRPVVRPWVERSTFVLAPLLLLLNIALPWSVWAGAAALGLAGVQAVRLAGWHDARVWRVPILAVLYLGYLWLVAGLVLDALAGFGLLPPFPALHALTAGALGVFTLGMMARVTLGHTGRAMRASGLTNAAFVLINLAALARVLPGLVQPAAYAEWLVVSGLLWAGAFGLFLWVHAPMLVSPRVDGAPG